MRAASALALSLAMAFAIAGCAGLRSDRPAPQTYLLRVEPSKTEAAGAPLASTLQVGRPLARPGLDTERIALVRPDQRLDYYASARWPGEAPQLIEALAVDALRERGDWTAVYDSRSFFPAEYLLQITVRRFEAEYAADGSPPTVHVTLDCSFGHRADRELLSMFVAEASAAAGANRLGAVVAAYEQATRAALHQIAERVNASARAAPVRTSTVPRPR